MQLEINAQAKRDIGVIRHQSLTRFGAAQADKYITDLFDLLDLLAINPFMARIRPEFTKSPRILRYKSHAVFYRVEGEKVKIVRILHGRQNWDEYI